MEDAAEQEAVAGKSILKRRIRNTTIGHHTNEDYGRSAQVPAPERHTDGCAERNTFRRYVTFDDTISVKNDKDLVVKKPLKLELVIENWKSSSAKTLPEKVLPDPGIVRRLVDEFNTIDDPLTDRPEIVSALSEEVKEVEEDEPTKIQTDIPLCELLGTVDLTTDDRTKSVAAKLTGGKITLLDRVQNLGNVVALVKVFNSKSASKDATADQRKTTATIDFH